MTMWDRTCHRSCVHGVLQGSYDDVARMPSEDAELSVDGLVDRYRNIILDKWAEVDP